MRWLMLTVVIAGGLLSVLQAAIDQQSGETQRRPKKMSLGEITEQLKRSVNGKAVVHNQCQSQGRAVQLEEGTEITEVSGCNMTFRTRKTSSSPDGLSTVEFTIHANLAELTTPPSVEPQAFAGCTSSDGAILKVISQAQPGKKIPTTRRAAFQAANGNSNLDQPETEISRKDLSFFFNDPIAAKRAARALDRVVKFCGGKEWPDDDDLP